MTEYEIGCLVLSSAALIVSLLLLSKDIFQWAKNNLSIKRLLVDFSNMENQGGCDDWIFGTLTITNKTNKEFTISDIHIISHLNCKIWRSENDKYGEPTQGVLALFEIRLHSHETIKIDLFVEVQHILENTPAVLSLSTPYGKFGYPIVLPACKYDNSDNQSVNDNQN